MNQNEAITLRVYSPERKVVDSTSAKSIRLTTTDGQIQILPGHARLIGILDPGVFEFNLQNGTNLMGFISHGSFEVEENIVSVFAETIELNSELDLERAKKAQIKAETALEKANISEGDFKKYQLKLQRSLIRQQIVSKTIH